MMITLEDTPAATELCSRWVGQASKEIIITSDSLNLPCLKQGELYDQLSEFARRNKRTQLKILLSEPSKVDLSLRLIRLCQRLTSHCQIKVLSDPSVAIDNFWIIDRQQYIHWQKESNSIGTANTNRPHSQKLYQLFIDQWHYNAEASAEFSLLNL